MKLAAHVGRCYTLSVAGNPAELDALRAVHHRRLASRGTPGWLKVVAVIDRRGETGHVDIVVEADSVADARKYLQERIAKVLVECVHCHRPIEDEDGGVCVDPVYAVEHRRAHHVCLDAFRVAAKH